MERVIGQTVAGCLVTSWLRVVKRDCMALLNAAGLFLSLKVSGVVNGNGTDVESGDDHRRR